MNFIELAARFCRESGISGDGPTSITGNVGEYQRVIDWINQAWLEIQMEHPNFAWMLGEVQFNTVAGQSQYTPVECGVTDHGMWKIDSFRCYPTASGTNGEMFMTPVTYDHWRDVYQFGTYRTTQTRPTVIADGDVGHKLCLGPVPEAGYTLVGQYYKVPSYMTSDADIPELPEQFHMAIVYRAMMEYAAYESAPEVYQRGEIKYKQMIHRLERDQAPRITTCWALA